MVILTNYPKLESGEKDWELGLPYWKETVFMAEVLLMTDIVFILWGFVLQLLKS